MLIIPIYLAGCGTYILLVLSEEESQVTDYRN